MRGTSRNTFNLNFPLRRLLLQGARAARGSPPLGQRLCDAEKGGGNGGLGGSSNGGGKHDKTGPSGSNKHNSDASSQHSANSPGNVDRGTSNSKLTPNNHKSSHSLVSKGGGSSTAGGGGSSASASAGKCPEECPLCYDVLPSGDEYYPLLNCRHYACRACLENYLMIQISESRTDISCPQCSDSMHPTDIQALLKAFPAAITKYEDFMVRRVLLSDPDSRWCPGPDCTYAVIATGCASCPRICCQRPGCDVQFCYHCKAEWHPDQTCDAARASRQSPTRVPSGSIRKSSQHKDEIKPCPRCQVLIVKMDDGSCNHMVCAICGSEFCWLCMKEISDLHYLSPSGCTFWGKKPWSRKKKLLWQLGTLVGAPLGIALVAGIAVPAMIIGIPVWVGRKIHTRYKSAGKHKRNFAVLGGVTASVELCLGHEEPTERILWKQLYHNIQILPHVVLFAPLELLKNAGGYVPKPYDIKNKHRPRLTDDFACRRLEETAGGPPKEQTAARVDENIPPDEVIVSPVLAGLAVAIGVPILLFYVYGVVPVSLCRAGCGEGTKFEYDEEEDNGSRNHDATSVDAVSRIGATSIGEVSLSVASGSHLGVSSQHSAYGVANPSTTALAGSITGHRLEVQADVSTSETASAVTCVSEKSGNTLNDTASTKALAGSILSYKQQTESSAFSEDGTSERVRFDNTVCYVIDGKKDSCDIWYTVPLDQDTAADKASLGSGRSFRSSERSFRDDFDSTSVSSAHKRINFGKLIPKLSSAQHRNLSVDSATGSYNIPENVSLEQELEQEVEGDTQPMQAERSSTAQPLHGSQVLPSVGSSSLQTISQNPSPQLMVRHEHAASSSVAVAIGTGSNTSSNEAINRAILIDKPTLAAYAAGTGQTEAAQNKKNESTPSAACLARASSIDDSSQEHQPGEGAAASPKSRTHILRNLFFSLPSPAEQPQSGVTTAECDQAKDALLPSTKTLSSPLSSTSSSSQSIPASTTTTSTTMEMGGSPSARLASESP
uniref:RBR-type E3 ubiquitin transferase n=1 Tax=Anopheles atroparvus TaxID=41427 RepID=A0A182J085_ANOAO